MRTRTFSNNPTYLKNMVYHHDIPSATTSRLPGGLPSGFLAGSARGSSCYVIEEEQSNEGQVDDNGNNQRNELDTSCSSADKDKDNFVEKGIDSNVKNNNRNINRQPAQSLPSTSNMSFTQIIFSNRSNDETDLLSQVSNETSFHDLRQDTSSPHMPDVKSGHLVLIIPEQKVTLINTKTDCSLLSRTLPRRCPVIVKIHDRGYEKYAIISSTRHQLALPSFCLKLKHSFVTHSPSNPLCFTVVVDSSEGKTFTFEASSPDVAREWMQTFTVTDSSLYWTNPGQRSPETSGETNQSSQCLTTNSKSSPAVLNLVHLPPMPVLSESLEEDGEE